MDQCNVITVFVREAEGPTHGYGQANVAVKLQTRIREELCLNLGRDTTILTDVFRGYFHSLWENARIVPELGHDRFLRNPFQSIIHQSSNHSKSHTVSATDSVLK
jgi:hypothetical protein